MNLLWSMPIPCANPWEPQFNGFFTRQNGEARFFYLDEGVCAASRLAEQPHVLHIPKVAGVSLPQNWQLREDLTPPLLLLTEQSALDLTALKVVKHDQPLEKKSAYPSWQLDEYRFDYDAEPLLTCTKNGVKVWQFRMRAYLYTPIRQWQDLIFFGTAGHGGYLYILRRETGEIVAAIKTCGTVHIAQDEGWCYALANTPGARLLKIDLFTGIIAEEVCLPGKVQYSSLRLMDGEVHAITYLYKAGRLAQAVWSCTSV